MSAQVVEDTVVHEPWCTQGRHHREDGYLDVCRTQTGTVPVVDDVMPPVEVLASRYVFHPEDEDDEGEESSSVEVQRVGTRPDADHTQVMSFSAAEARRFAADLLAAADLIDPPAAAGRRGRGGAR